MDGYRERPTIAFLFLLLLIQGCLSDRSVRRHWDFRTGDLMPGTRFDRRFGEIFYRGVPVPRGLSVLACPLGVFVYRAPVAGSSGYFGWVPSPDRTPVFRSRRGGGGQPYSGGFWYRGAINRSRAGTPVHWVWIRYRGTGYWIDPAGLGYFISRRGAAGKSAPRGD